MQQLENLSCGLFTIKYVVDLTFGLDPKKSIYNVHSNTW
jgi:hypothetical protein